MIHRMVLDIQDKLHVRGFPVAVVYGPERLERQAFAHAIVFERERDAPDEIKVQAATKGPKLKRGVRVLRVGATIYAQASVAGAHVGDHEDECEKIVDGLLTSLYEWGAENQTGGIPVTEVRYLAASEFGENFRQWPGVAYRVRFGVPRGVYALTYTGAHRPTGTITGISNTTEVSRDKAPDGEEPEIGCGAEPDP
jgi:hypothetical protein